VNFLVCVFNPRSAGPTAMLSASAEQIGIASRMRDKVHGKDRKMLNYVVHSPRPHPRYGKNPFADCSGYDPKVTDLLQDVAKRHALPAEDVDLVEVMHEVKELLCKFRSAKMRSA
jgi:hypothetical protein